MFSKDQQEKLKLAAHNGEKAVDKVIAGIKKESPELFHDDASIKDRVFFDQPDPGRKSHTPGICAHFRQC
jgi:hypothetical protein